MYVQYSENFPGISIDQAGQKIYVNSQNAYNELEKFYENFLANNLDYFTISPDYASGFYSLLNYLIHKPSGSKIAAIKCQTTGPITFGLSLKNENGKIIFYDSQLKDAVIKHIAMKSLWQIKKFIEKTKQTQIILFLDEPYLAAYGSAFTSISSEEIINSLQETIKKIQDTFNLIAQPLEYSITLLIGVHCCANTDWSILLETNIDILSFDAYEFFDNLVLYSDKLKNFIERGGLLAWGIVPTSEEFLKNENVKTLSNKLNDRIKKLSEKKFDIKKLTKQILITPSCGLGTKTEQTAETVLSLLNELANNLNLNSL